MPRLERDLFSAPQSHMRGDDLVLVTELHPVHVSLHNDRTVGVTDRDRIVVPIESNQSFRVHGGGVFPARIEPGGRKRQKSGLIFSKQDFLAGRLSPQTALSVLPAALGQLIVEFFQAADLWHRHQKVLSAESHHGFDDALLVPPADLTEVCVEQIVALQLQKSCSQLSFMGSQNLCYQSRVIVVGNPPRNPTEELEGPTMGVPPDFRGNPLKNLHEDRIGVRQRHHEER